MVKQLHDAASGLGISLRTLANVKDALARARKKKSDAAIASLLLNYGRLTDEAREYLSAEYPSA